MTEAAIKAVSRLAEAHGVQISATLPDPPVMTLTDPAAAQQVCIHLLSQTVQAAAPDALYVMLDEGEEGTSLTLEYSPRTPGAPVPVGAAVQGFIERLRLTLEQTTPTRGGARVRLHFSARRAALLIIDDHAGLTDLIQRYVADRALQVLAASDALSGLALAREMQPSVVLLDLMMPGMDGWELLQRLRTTPETAHLPVIICSVINDPELAYSLGASYFLPKPITRETLAAALAQVGV
jgi:CheY-like chemotaxis protein